MVYTFSKYAQLSDNFIWYLCFSIHIQQSCADTRNQFDKGFVFKYLEIINILFLFVMKIFKYKSNRIELISKDWNYISQSNCFFILLNIEYKYKYL